MGLFRRNHYNDVLYLMPIRLGNEKLPKDITRMLCCDAKGHLSSALIEKSVYESARSKVRRMKRTHNTPPVQHTAPLGGHLEPPILILGQKALLDKLASQVLPVPALHVLAAAVTGQLVMSAAKDILGL